MTLFDPKKLRAGDEVIWLYRGEPEVGTVVLDPPSPWADRVDLIWLEGYKSRNDSPMFEEILAVFDKHGKQYKIGPFSGTGHLTKSGSTWVEEHNEVPTL